MKTTDEKQKNVGKDKTKEVKVSEQRNPLEKHLGKPKPEATCSDKTGTNCKTTCHGKPEATCGEKTGTNCKTTCHGKPEAASCHKPQEIKPKKATPSSSTK